MTLEAWLTVLHAEQAGGRGLKRAVRRVGSAAALLAQSDASLARDGLEAATLRALRQPDPAVLDAWRAWLAAPDRALVTADSAAYPPLLATIPNAPLAVWTRGADLSLLAAPQVAIVGSRSATTGGRYTAAQFARYLSRHGLTVTSGLAIGIDAAAHVGALDGPGRTLAVLGCGIDLTYPRVNAGLAERVAEQGLLVSEYAPGTPVRGAQFPKRNRIIAGLALGTVVVEAARRSGSLITARLAGEFGRDVFAVPGSIRNDRARGCHALIRDGARLVEQAAEILAEIAPSIELDDAAVEPSRDAEDEPRELDPGYRKLLDLLGFDAIDRQSLVDRSGLTPAELSSMLLILELEGYVEALPGGRYSRAPKRG